MTAAHATPGEALRAMDARATKGPWVWGVHDYSMASIEGPGGEYDHVLSVSPCKACADRVQPDERGEKAWVWGRCTTPKQENAEMITTIRNALPALADLLDAADALREAIEGEHDGGAPCFVDCEGCEAVPAYDTARAALVAALEGK